ncbi:MAG: FAD-linked oxidase C-terminal domain-containing protein [Solirubrobacteraceae bacterium]
MGLARQRFLAGLDQGVTTLARELKRALDPEGILNPGKLFDR